MYPKIDIYVNGEYFCSTNSSLSLKEAKIKFLKNPTKVSMGVNGIETIRAKNINRVVCKWAEKK